MVELPPEIAAQRAILQQNVALSSIRRAAQVQQQFADIILDSSRSIAASGRGQNVNFST